MHNRNVVPKMTGATTEGVTITESAKYQTSSKIYDGWKAFARIKSTTKEEESVDWATPLNTPYGWVMVDFGNDNYKINKYSITSRYAINHLYTQECPKNWTFEGSNDGIKFDILDTVINMTNWSSLEKRTFSFINEKFYRFYKINITSNNGHIILSLDDIELFGIREEYYYIILYNKEYYSIKPDNYLNGQYVKLNVSEIPNKEIFEKYGIMETSLLTQEITLEDEIFKPIDKFKGDIKLIEYKTQRS